MVSENENVVKAGLRREAGRWVLRLTVPEWVMMDILRDQENNEERTPIIIDTPAAPVLPSIGMTVRRGMTTSLWGQDDKLINEYLGTTFFEIVETKKDGSDDDEEGWYR